jgi:MYXO-CTERM domain-containing protein
MRFLAFPSRTLAPLAAAGVLGALLLASPRASAYDSLATACADKPLYCEIAPIKYDKTDALPIQWSFDTGWVPQGSPLQVHIWADVWANTHIALAGSLQSSWPDALSLIAPGKKEGGDFGFHYGADFGAQGKVTISIAGQTYSWTGDLPYVPQFDFEVKADKGFDAWAYAPGVTIANTSMPQKIAQIGLSDIITTIPGLDGGFELDVAMELDATYTTDRIVVSTTDGQPVSGGPITAPDGKSFSKYMSGPSMELDVHPEGNVDYDGKLHLIPAFYISVLGKSWSIPVADIPIPFPITSTQWVFDNQRVHVPLPDLVLPKTKIDFGDVDLGQKSLVSFSLWNAGEAKIAAAISSTDAEIFPPWDTQLDVDPTVTVDTAVRFIPQKNGVFSAKLLVASNDPSDPVQIIELTGRGVGRDVPFTPPAGAEVVENDAESTCACRSGGNTGGSSGAPFAAALLGLAAVLRRRSKR